MALILVSVSSGCGTEDEGNDQDECVLDSCSGGGDVVGTWNLESSCSFSPGLMTCADGSESSQSSITGTLALGTDGAYVYNSTATSTITLHLSATCLSSAPAGYSCNNLPFQCEAHRGGCDCPIQEGTTTVNEMGTYSVSGAQITLSPTGKQSRTYEFCVSDTSLTLQLSDMYGGRGQLRATRQSIPMQK